MNKLLAWLIQDEGFRGRPYRDTKGKVTIGYGRNLDALPLTRDEATYLMVGPLTAAQGVLQEHLPWFDGLDLARQAALLNMAYNMGPYSLLKFRRMLAALERGDWAEAAREALDSKWHRDVGPNRAGRIARTLESGDFPPDV